MLPAHTAGTHDGTTPIAPRTRLRKLYNADVIAKRRYPYRFWILLVAGLLLVGAAAMADERVSQWVHARNLGPAVRQSPIAKVVKWPGVFYFTLVVAAVVAGTGRERWRESLVLLLAGILAGLAYVLAKWCAGRTRPFPRNLAPESPFTFHPFHNGVAGLWKADNQAFPSGHTCLAFSTAAALGMIFPRGRVPFYLIATCVGVERVLEGAHYPSDVTAGAVLGVLSAVLAARLLRGLLVVGPEPRGFPVLPAHNAGRGGAVVSSVSDGSPGASHSP